MSAMPYSTRPGGLCCRPMALRTMNSTTDILRNAVSVATAIGSRAAAVTKIRTPTILTPGSGMLEQPGDAHAEAVADPHQRSMTDALAVGNDVERLIERPHQRNQRARRERGQLLQRHIDAAQLKDDADRNGLDTGVFEPGRFRRVDVVFHAPLPGRLPARRKRCGQPAAIGL